MDGNKHYIRTDAAGVIILGFSDAFPEIATPQADDILILEDGPRHFQEAFPDLLNPNDRGQMRYRWSSGQIVIRTQAELDAEWSARPPAPPSETEQLKSQMAEANLQIIDLFEQLLIKGVL